MLVDVPKPLSSKRTGIVSSSIFEVAHKSTPAPNPNRNRPKHINLKFSERERTDPISASILNYIIVFLGPLTFTQSPPNRDPALIPIIDAVDKTVM